MKKFILITSILLIGLVYFGLPTDNSKRTFPTFNQEKNSATYTPWSNPTFEELHQALYFREAATFQIKNKKMVPLEQIAPSFQQAILAMEDRKFYDHLGFDWEGMVRAGLVNLQKGSIEEGASTITQQVAKNIFLTQEQNYSRKAKEVYLAIQLEKNFSKSDILTIYLNTIYYGSNAYGISEASRIYFDKDPMRLTLAESAMLAGTIPAPSLYSPHVNLGLAKERQKIVLTVMQKLGIITPPQYEEALNEKIYIAPL